MKNRKLFKYVLLTPIFIYTIALVLLPLIYIFIISFLKNDVYGGLVFEFTLNNYIRLFNFVYIKVFLKSILIASITTLICILIAYPFVIFINSKKESVKNILITLVMVPFLTNSLIRMYGWIILLRKNGIINTTLINLNIIDEPLSLLYNNFAIILGLVYTLLPFMILPLNNAMSKIDKSILESSADLGANKFQTFKHIIFPMTFSGVFNGAIMVFIPAIGYFFITDILGGGKFMILGNLIKNQFLTARNWPFGASISIVLLIITLLLVLLYKKLGGKMDELGGM